VRVAVELPDGVLGAEGVPEPDCVLGGEVAGTEGVAVAEAAEE
jgi:hypothetical protein